MKAAEKEIDNDANPTSSKKAKIEYDDEGGDFGFRGDDEELSDDEFSEDDLSDDEDSNISDNEEFEHYLGLRGGGGSGEDGTGHQNNLSDCDLQDWIEGNRHRTRLIFATLRQGRGEVTGEEYERCSRGFGRDGGIASADKVRCVYTSRDHHHLLMVDSAYLKRANDYVLGFREVLLTGPPPPPEPPVMNTGRRRNVTPILPVGAVIVRMPNTPTVKQLPQGWTDNSAIAHATQAAGPAENDAQPDPQVRAHPAHQAAPREYDGIDEWEYDRRHRDDEDSEDPTLGLRGGCGGDAVEDDEGPSTGKGSDADTTSLILFYVLSKRAITTDEWQQVADDLQKHGHTMTWNAVNLRYRKFKKRVLESNPVGGAVSPTAPEKRRARAPKAAAKKPEESEVIVREDVDSNEDPNRTPQKKSKVAEQTVTADHEDEVVEDAIEEASLGVRGSHSGDAAEHDSPPSGKASMADLDQLMYVFLMEGRKITTDYWDHVLKRLAECGHTATLGSMKIRLHRAQHKVLDRLESGVNAQAAPTTPKKRRYRVPKVTPKKAGKFKALIKGEEVESYSEEDVNPTPQEKTKVSEQLESVQYNDEDIFEDSDEEGSSLGLRGGAGGDDTADAEFELGHALDIFSVAPPSRV